MESLLFNQTANSSLTNANFPHQNSSFPLSHLCKDEDVQCQSQQGESSWVRWWKAMEGDQIPLSLPAVSISLLILTVGLCLNFILVLIILRTVARAKGERSTRKTWGARAVATTVTIPDANNKNNGKSNGADTSISSSCDCSSTSILCDCCLNCLVLKGANFGNTWTGNNNNEDKKVEAKEKQIDFERQKQYYRISYGCRDGD